MPDYKIVFGLKDGSCVQKEVKEPDSNAFFGKKIGDTVSGDECGFPGYEFQITGGSDNAGFPMRPDVVGTGRKKILAVKGIGVTNKKKYRGKNMKGLRKMKGMRTRKTIAGNTVSAAVAQINVKVTKQGAKPLVEKSAEGSEAPAEEKKE